ncbi:oxygenase MpaB family protein [Sphingobacterium cavernae]|uniref:oxygenase MpaB family protein n=1 Tax=Sphingobacterium cavernae TaxID=2592657 RepID=UPI00122FDC65|nr:oxygenase MpaB family protein [Sphingobacterium cavernae]
MWSQPYRYKINESSFAHYWNEGVGVELLQKLGYVPDIAIAEKLIPFLYEWDRHGDQLVLDLHDKKGFVQGNNSLSSYLNHEQLPTEEKLIWDEFFAKIDIEPNWLDQEKLKFGSELSRRAGLSALIVLRDYCLMGGYESAAINKPLIYTGALKKGAVKRLNDTVNFWVNITKEGGLEQNSEGFRQIFLTRCIHSYSRISILKRTDWDSNKWGIPLNTWDMLATNLGFSLVFLVGLRKIGIQPSPKEVDGLFHFWKYVGSLLGIPLALLPENENEAIEALYLWTMTQREGDEDSRSLADALKEEPVLAHYPKNKLMRLMMREVHLFYNNFLLGEYSCKLLGLSNTKIGRFGLVNIWKTRQNERTIVDEETRLQSIHSGGEEQERVRMIYQEFNNSQSNPSSLKL